jgi:hypothetical protein
MKPFISVLVWVLLCQPCQGVERPWQKIVDPQALEVAALFKTPPPEYGLSLLWGWNGDVNREVIQADLDMILSRNIHVVTIEAGYDMPDPYLSDGWFGRIKIAVGEAEKRDMRVWLIDEGKYPSGFAGGKFSQERPDLRMQGLGIAERIPVTAGQTLSRKLAPEIVSAAAVHQADSTSQTIDVRSGLLNWTAPQGQWEVILVDHQFRTAVTRAANNPTRGKDAANSLCDFLNPEATRQFIAFTHAQYEKVCGDAFGHTILGFRGDEPDYAHVPWTPGIVETFEKHKGYDVRPYLASFLIDNGTVTEEARRAKADYWDIWSDLFAENFFKIQADWCSDRDMEYMVHLNNEHRMDRLVRSTGEFFKAMRHVQVPGVDAIWNQVWPGNVADFVKLASSASHVFGRPRALTESFAAYRIRPNAVLGKWALDYQMVRGINQIEIMYYPASSSGRPRRGWLVSEEFPAVAE